MPSSSGQNSSEPPSLLHTLGALFSGVLLALLWSKFRAPNQQPSTSNRTQDDTADARQRRQEIPPSPMRVAIDSFPPPNTPPQQREAKRKNKQRWKYFGALIKICTVVLLVVVAVLTRLQWLELRRANKLTNQSLEANERPRVALDNKGDEGIVFFDSLASNNATTLLEFRLKYLLKNLGHSPANVEVLAELIDQAYPRSGALEKLVNKKCEEDESSVRAKEHEWHVTIVQEMSYGHATQLTITDAMRKEGFARPTIVGCIWYRSTTTGAIYKTPFAGQISMSTDENGGRAQDWNPVRIPLAFVHNHPRPNTRVVDVLIMGGTT